MTDTETGRLQPDDRVRTVGGDDVGRVLDPDAKLGDETVVACRFPGDDTVSIHRPDELELVGRGSGDGDEVVRDMVREALGRVSSAGLLPGLRGAILVGPDGPKLVELGTSTKPDLPPYRLEWLEDVQKGWVLLLEGNGGPEEVVVIDRRDRGGAVSLKLVDRDGDQRGLAEHELYLVRRVVTGTAPMDRDANPT